MIRKRRLYFHRPNLVSQLARKRGWKYAWKNKPSKERMRDTLDYNRCQNSFINAEWGARIRPPAPIIPPVQGAPRPGYAQLRRSASDAHIRAAAKPSGPCRLGQDGKQLLLHQHLHDLLLRTDVGSQPLAGELPQLPERLPWARRVLVAELSETLAERLWAEPGAARAWGGARSDFGKRRGAHGWGPERWLQCRGGRRRRWRDRFRDCRVLAGGFGDRRWSLRSR